MTVKTQCACFDLHVFTLKSARASCQKFVIWQEKDCKMTVDSVIFYLCGFAVEKIQQGM